MLCWLLVRVQVPVVLVQVLVVVVVVLLLLLLLLIMQQQRGYHAAVRTPPDVKPSATSLHDLTSDRSMARAGKGFKVDVAVGLH
jgi:hypothetical protein